MWKIDKRLHRVADRAHAIEILAEAVSSVAQRLLPADDSGCALRILETGQALWEVLETPVLRGDKL